MITLIWLIAILGAACLGYSNALLAIIAILLLEIGLTVGRAKEGIATLCKLLKDDDEPGVEQTIRQMDEAVKRMTVAKFPVGPQTVQMAPPDWFTVTKES